MKRTIATTLAALVAAGGFWITAGVNAEASSTRAPRAHATQVAKPHAGQRCAAYSHVKRGQKRSCVRWVNR